MTLMNTENRFEHFLRNVGSPARLHGVITQKTTIQETYMYVF
jgi:hypothetical protein